MSLTPEEIKAIATEAAEAVALACVDQAAERAAKKVAMTSDEISEVVRTTLLQMGVDSGNPIEAQKDFQHLRQWRRAGEELRSKSLVGLLALFITGLVSLVLLGLRQYFNG